jgi:hypothetical protein
MTAQEQRQYERECLLERAAIIEYCGNVLVPEAERMARQQFEEQKTKDLMRPFGE